MQFTHSSWQSTKEFSFLSFFLVVYTFFVSAGCTMAKLLAFFSCISSTIVIFTNYETRSIWNINHMVRVRALLVQNFTHNEVVRCCFFFLTRILFNSVYYYRYALAHDRVRLIISHKIASPLSFLYWLTLPLLYMLALFLINSLDLAEPIEHTQSEWAELTGKKERVFNT